MSQGFSDLGDDFIEVSRLFFRIPLFYIDVYYFTMYVIIHVCD